jgi:hypothetical protein
MTKNQQQGEMSQRSVQSSLLTQKDDSRRVPSISVSSNIDQVWNYVEHVLNQQKEDYCIIQNLKDFIFNQHINGKTFLNLSKEKLLKCGLAQLGSREALLSVVGRSKSAKGEKEIKADNHM